jgi:hypothetical protein
MDQIIRLGRDTSKHAFQLRGAFGHWAVHTFLTGLRCHELCAPWVIDGPIIRLAFDVYIETQLAPTLRQGDVGMLDNLAVHRREKAAQYLKQHGA